jgi:vacuolar-type H+-ATPase subunit I/STV1
LIASVQRAAHSTARAFSNQTSSLLLFSLIACALRSARHTPRVLFDAQQTSSGSAVLTQLLSSQSVCGLQSLFGSQSTVDILNLFLCFFHSSYFSSTPIMYLIKSFTLQSSDKKTLFVVLFLSLVLGSVSLVLSYLISCPQTLLRSSVRPPGTHPKNSLLKTKGY